MSTDDFGCEQINQQAVRLGFQPRPDQGLSVPGPGPASAGPVLVCPLRGQTNEVLGIFNALRHRLLLFRTTKQGRISRNIRTAVERVLNSVVITISGASTTFRILAGFIRARIVHIADAIFIAVE
jgi:hypothetical protein